MRTCPLLNFYYLWELLAIQYLMGTYWPNLWGLCFHTLLAWTTSSVEEDEKEKSCLVARLPVSLYSQGFWCFARSRSREIQVNPRNPAKFGRNLIKYMSVQQFWNLSQLQGVFTCRNVPVNSKTAHPPRAIPGHLTRVKLCAVGNLTQNEARPVGHLTFVSKRLSAVGNKRISQFFDSVRAPRSRVIALVDSTWVFLLLSFLYRGICLCLKCGAKTSWTRNS